MNRYHSHIAPGAKLAHTHEYENSDHRHWLDAYDSNAGTDAGYAAFGPGLPHASCNSHLHGGMDDLLAYAQQAADTATSLDGDTQHPRRWDGVMAATKRLGYWQVDLKNSAAAHAILALWVEALAAVRKHGEDVAIHVLTNSALASWSAQTGTVSTCQDGC